jgi:hypothetical protein
MEALAENHLRAVADFVGRASVPIIARGGPGQDPWVARGTGAWFRVPQKSEPDRVFLLTAAHVVFGSNGDLSGDLFVPVTRPGVAIGIDTVRLRDFGVATFVKRHNKDVPDTEHMDAVVLEVRRDLADRILASDWAILDVDNIGPHSASAGSDGAGYMISGYPECMAGPYRGGFASTPITMLLDRYDGEFSFLGGGFDLDLDLLLKRPDRDLASGRTVAPFELNGVSGALIWALRAWNVRGIWNPRRCAVVVGHQIHATDTSYLRARRGVALARLLQRAAPEIADEIEARLQGRIAD